MWINKTKNLSPKGIFEELIKGRFGEVIELTDKTNFDDLIYYVQGYTDRKRFDEFEKPF